MNRKKKKKNIWNHQIAQNTPKTFKMIKITENVQNTLKLSNKTK